MYCFSIFIACARRGPRALNGTQEIQLQKNKTQAAALPPPLSASHTSSTNGNPAAVVVICISLRANRGQERRGQLSWLNKSLRGTGLKGLIPTSEQCVRSLVAWTFFHRRNLRWILNSRWHCVWLSLNYFLISLEHSLYCLSSLSWYNTVDNAGYNYLPWTYCQKKGCKSHDKKGDPTKVKSTEILFFT